MAGLSCAIVPRVKNKNGESVDSKLFRDIMGLTRSREVIKSLWSMVTDPSFVEENRDRLEFDENGEPTLHSIIKNFKIDDFVSPEEMDEALMRKWNAYDPNKPKENTMPNTAENRDTVEGKAVEFNDKSACNDTHIARPITVSSPKRGKKAVALSIERKTPDNAAIPKALKTQHLLNQRLRELCNKWGIPIEALTEAEEAMGIGGVTEFGSAQAMASGLATIIRLAKGMRGEEALPEEFSHFIIRALHDDPFVKRLLNLLDKNESLLEEIYGEEYDKYKKKYNNDRYKLVEEAAGKLLGQHLEGAMTRTKEIPAKPYRNILQKVIDAIKRFFSRFNENDVVQATKDVNAIVDNIATRVLTEEVTPVEFDKEELKHSDRLFNITSDKVKNTKQIIDEIKKIELKRYNILKSKVKDPKDYTQQQKQTLDQLQKAAEDNEELSGLCDYLKQALDILNGLSIELRRINETDNLQKKARILRNIRIFIDSYQHVLDLINPRLVQMLDEITPVKKKLRSVGGYSIIPDVDINATPEDEDPAVAAKRAIIQRMQDSVNSLTGCISIMNSRYKEVAKPLFIQAMKPFVGDGIVLKFGGKKRVIKAEEIIERADKDISFFDRWLDSAADSGDYMIKVIDQMVKKQKHTARLEALDFRKRLEAIGIRAEQAGITDYEWMFEHDAEGHKTGRYIGQYRFKEWYDKKKAFWDQINKKYPNPQNLTEAQQKERKREINEWYAENTEKFTDTDGKEQTRPAAKYLSEEYKALSTAQREFYDDVMAIKKELDDKLPPHYTHQRNAVKILRDTLERAKHADGVTSGLKTLAEGIRDSFMRRSDDTEYGDKAALQDFDDNEVQMLPIYYTRLREGENPDDLSTDIVSTMTAYAAMACDFEQMDKIIDTLEVGRELMHQRKIPQRSGGKALVEKLKIGLRSVDSNGNPIESKEEKIENPLYKPAGTSRAEQRLDDYFKMQVYGRYMADEGTIGKKIDVGKFLNQINHVTVLNTFALNLLAGISNIATGSVMMNIEAAAGQFFSPSDLLKADGVYSQEVPLILFQVGLRQKTSKLALMDERFNVMQDYEREFKDTRFDRRSRFSRLMSEDRLYFLNSIGEHWMQNRTFLALCMSTKVKDADGTEMNLWDAYEVVPVDPAHPDRGSKVQLKEGITKMDGSAFTVDDEYAITRKAAAINQHMHGIYNQIDKSAIQQFGVGRLAITFRKYIKPSLNKRFGSDQWNFDLGVETEGYYRTAGKFLQNLAKDLKKGELNIMASWDKLEDEEKQNIHRAFAEVGQFIAIAAILALAGWGDDEKNRPWYLRMLEYQTRRLYTEIGAFVPGPQMLSEGLRILKSPMAATNVVERTLDLVNLLDYHNYETFVGDEAIIRTGRFKGHSKAERLFWRAPIIPMSGTIYRGLHPEEGIPFFKQ